MVETSSIQSQNQKYLKDRETQYIDSTNVPRRFYEQVTYNNQKQTYIFVENNAIVSIANSMYVIYHDPIKSFKYNQKTKTFQQIDIQECELTTRHLLCQDAIFHRIIDAIGSDTQRTPISHIY